MPVLNDEVPDEGDFDAGRRRGEFDDITPEDFVSGAPGGNPPGWLDADRVNDIRRQVPMVYVEVVPVHIDDFGRVLQVGTLLRVSDDGSVERTLVRFRPLTPGEIAAYVATGEPMDKAGAYGAQGVASLFVEGITGDFFNVMGLPMCVLGRMLSELGVSLL